MEDKDTPPKTERTIVWLTDAMILLEEKHNASATERRLARRSVAIIERYQNLVTRVQDTADAELLWEQQDP